jgi:tetratricopeptide (TPR) repeat protein
MKGDDMKAATVFLVTLLLGGPTFATTWAPSEKTDPLTGEKVSAQEIMSYDSYIYNWPSKYDLVFWPLTDENWICLNPKNGYAAFNDDFERLSDEEKKVLTDWLAKNYKPAQPPTSHKEKLAWLEKVYGQRKMNDDFWCRFYRLMAYIDRDDVNRSLAYVQKALPLLKRSLDQDPKGTDRLEVLYLLGEYHRRLGESKKAEEYFGQVKDVRYKDEEGKEQVGHPYFAKLVQDRQSLRKEGASNKTDAGDGK